MKSTHDELVLKAEECQADCDENENPDKDCEWCVEFCLKNKNELGE